MHHQNQHFYFSYAAGVGGENSGIHGVEMRITEMNDRKTALEEMIFKFRQEAMKINEMAGLFFTSCQEVQLYHHQDGWCVRY